MRILLVSSLYPPDQVGGAEVLVAQLAQDLAAGGHDVAVACLSRELSVRDEASGVRVYRLGHGPVFFPMDWGRSSGLQRAAYKVATQLGSGVLLPLQAAIKDFRPDVINTHSLAELSARIWAVAAALGVPVVHTLHDFSGLCTNGALFRDGHVCERLHVKCLAYGALHKLESRHVGGVIGVGRDILSRHLQAGHFPHTGPSSQFVIWNPVEVPQRRPRANRDTPVFGFLGRIEPSKGADLLIQACRLLPAQGWRLKIAGRAIDGDGPYRAASADMPIEFTGFVDRDDFFNQIDCLIAPPLWPEAFGRTVAEAYLRGTPVIGADIAGVAEQIKAVAPQWLFKAGDPASLAEQMKIFLSDPAAAAPPPAALARFAERVSPPTITRQYLASYAVVL